MFRRVRKALGFKDRPPKRRKEIVRVTPSYLYMIGGNPQEDDRYGICPFQRYSFVEKRWYMIQETMPETRSAFAVATYDGCMWVIGGKDSDHGTTNTVFVYNPNATAGERWTSGTPINHGRHGLCAAVLDGKLYALGGTEEEGASDCVEIWNGEAWELGKPMVVRRTDFSVGVLKRRIYAVGGDEECRMMNFPVEVYCPISDRWTAVGTQASQSIRRGVGVAGNVLYSAGDAYFSCLRRNVLGFHSWSVGPDIPTNIEGFDVAVDCTRLYIVGGVPDDDTATTFYRLKTTESYSRASFWYPLPAPLGPPRYDVKVAIL